MVGKLPTRLFRDCFEAALTPPVDPTLALETRLHEQGFPRVIGCDEVGRGPLAGPVVVGLVVWEPTQGAWPEGLRDSKALSEKKRPAIAEAIPEFFPHHAIGQASPQEIDDRGIVVALATAVVRGLRDLASQGVAVGSSVLLLDGSHDFVTPHLPHPLAVRTREKADRDCVSVAAASVLAKVHRDATMVRYAATYPEYGFESNKGYGSAGHRQAITDHGVTEVHRTTWIHF